MDSIENISKRLIDFRENRDWLQFHTVKNLVLALQGELGELSKIVQWLGDDDVFDIDDVSEEISDIFIYLVNLCNVMEIDLIQSANKKIAKNAINYPIEKCKGTAKGKGEL